MPLRKDGPCPKRCRQPMRASTIAYTTGTANNGGSPIPPFTNSRSPSIRRGSATPGRSSLPTCASTRRGKRRWKWAAVEGSYAKKLPGWDSIPPASTLPDHRSRPPFGTPAQTGSQCDTNTRQANRFPILTHTTMSFSAAMSWSTSVICRK